jgi:dipeptidyl aminopeptidase/acylaminoacyl peptidase
VRVEYLPLHISLSAPTVHPDRSHVVVAATRPDLDADAYVGQLWRVPLDGGAPRRITRGFRDTAPQFSPDGRLLGFLRATPDGPPQVALVPAEGGEPMVVTAAKLGVAEFAFHPDGTKLAFAAREPEDGRYGTRDGVGATAEDPRLLSTLQFETNGIGYIVDQRYHVFVLDVPDPSGEPAVKPVGRAASGGSFRAVPEARRLTTAAADHRFPVWDGDDVLVVAALHDGADADLRQDIYRFSPTGGEPVRLTDSAAGDSAYDSPVVADDTVYFIGSHTGADGREFFGQNPGVFAVPRSGGRVRRLTDAESVHASGLVADGDGVVGIDLVRGGGEAFRVDAQGTMQRLRTPGSVLAVGASGGVRAAVCATGASPGEVVLLDLPEVAGHEALRARTDFAAALQQAAAPLVPLELTAAAPDGYPVHGWVVRPEGEGPHPVLLMMHGGPFVAYGPGFLDEAQVYARAGYAVAMCNPRGSAGYGQAHAAAIHGAFGDRDAVDVLAFLDHALATVPGLAADRLGVMGGSYGGFLAAWLIAHESRFAAAIVERGYLDPPSFVGASDIGWFFPAGVHGDAERMIAQSPMELVDQVRTPTLVIHSELDLRCPLATAKRYYTELRLRGVDAQLLVFPGEDHELSRSGSPQHRKARFEHILAWWARHVPVA